MENYVEKILMAPVYDVAIESPLDPLNRLAARLGQHVLLKREDLQPVFSFKLRGAYNKMYQCREEARQHGVICASAGNHAQGVALAARTLKIKATIVMPKTTPAIKVKAVRYWGEEWAEIILHGDFYDDASAYAQSLIEKRHLIYIPSFNDSDVIAGQGTIGLEILRQHPRPIDAIFVPVGGGGLMAGIAVLIKQLRPDIKIIGVEPEDAAAMTASFKAGKIVNINDVNTFADGVAVKKPGPKTFELIHRYVDEFVNVSTDEICAAIKDIFDDTRSIAEPSGALATAGLKKWASTQNRENMTLIAINSGANVNFDRLRYIAERAEIGEQGEGLLAVTIDERPGSFRKFCQIIGENRVVTEFNYRYQHPDKANIFVGIQLSHGRRDLEETIQSLEQSGYPTINLSDNELAKLHLRYMVGGHAPSIHNEHLFRVTFPERPGALLHFLNTLGDRFNISLFHYRNHGSDYGRIVVGIQSDDLASLRQHMDAIGYTYYAETDNPAYKIFLQN